MFKVALRGVFARKLRAFLTALAVFLGVSLMTGTYVLTDTFTNSFGQIFEESSVGIERLLRALCAAASVSLVPDPRPTGALI